jgi:rsbT co-antagonist protein RsbR
MTESVTVSVPLDSLVRLRDALQVAIDGGFDDALARLAAEALDVPGEVGQAARALIADYQALVVQQAFSIDEFLAAKRELQRKLDTIEQQQAAIQRLSAPIIDVWDKIVTVPLTDLDAAYADELSARLLARIADSKLAWVIIDLTGAPGMDTTLAEHLIRLAQSIRLMGAECLVTGIGPKAAQTLAALDVSLTGLHTLASLKDGLKHCIALASRSGARRL